MNGHRADLLGGPALGADRTSLPGACSPAVSRPRDSRARAPVSFWTLGWTWTTQSRPADPESVVRAGAGGAGNGHGTHCIGTCGPKAPQGAQVRSRSWVRHLRGEGTGQPGIGARGLDPRRHGVGGHPAMPGDFDVTGNANPSVSTAYLDRGPPRPRSRVFDRRRRRESRKPTGGADRAPLVNRRATRRSWRWGGTK